MTTALLRFSCGHDSLIKGACDLSELVTFARRSSCPACVRKTMEAELPSTDPKPPDPEDF